MRGNSQLKAVFVGKSFDSNFSGTLNTGFPLGRGWRFMLLNVHYALVRDAGTLVAADADLKALRRVSLKDDRGNKYLEDVPGVFLYRRARRLYRTLGQRTAVAAASATYSTQFIIPFIDPLARRGDDTIINTADVKEMSLSLQFGSLADFLSTSGTESLTITADCYVGQTADVLPQQGAGAVGFVQCLRMLPQVDPSSRDTLDVTGEENEYLRRLHVLTCNSGSAYPCAGTPAANVLSKLDLRSVDDKDFDDVTVFTHAAYNKARYQEETAETGFYTFEFNEGKSLMESMKLNRNNAQLKWTTDTLSTSRLNALAEVIALRK